MSKLTDDAAFALAQRNYDNEPEPVADEIEGRCECGETTICGRCPRCDNDERKLIIECPECGLITTNYKCTHCQQRGI